MAFVILGGFVTATLLNLFLLPVLYLKFGKSRKEKATAQDRLGQSSPGLSSSAGAKRQAGLRQTKIAVPGMSRPRSGDQPPHGCSLPSGHSGSTRSTSTSPAADDLAHPVAEGAVVLDVGRPRPSSSCSTYGRAVEVRVARRRARRARVVGEGPAHRVGRREDEPPAGPQHPGRLAPSRTSESATNGHDAVCREDGVEGTRRRRGGRGRRTGRRARGCRRAGRRVRVDRDARSRPCRPTGRWPRPVAPWAASQREHCAGAGADLEHDLAAPGRRAGAAPPRASRSGPQTKSVSPRNDAVLDVVRPRPRRPTTCGWPRPSRPGERRRRVASRGRAHGIRPLVLTGLLDSADRIAEHIRVRTITVAPVHKASGARPSGPAAASVHQSNCPQSEFLLHDCQHGREDRPSGRHQRHRL